MTEIELDRLVIYLGIKVLAPDQRGRWRKTGQWSGGNAPLDSTHCMAEEVQWMVTLPNWTFAEHLSHVTISTVTLEINWNIYRWSAYSYAQDKSNPFLKSQITAPSVQKPTTRLRDKRCLLQFYFRTLSYQLSVRWGAACGGNEDYSSSDPFKTLK